MTFRRLWSAVACLLLICGCQSTDLASQSLNPLRTPKTSGTNQAAVVSAETELPRDEPSPMTPPALSTARAERDRIEQFSATTTEPIRDQQLDAAHAELQAGRRESAAELFQQVLERTPNHPRAHHGLAVIADADSRYADAEFHYKRALEQLPHDPNVLNDLGYSYLLQNRLNEAETYLEKATRIQPMHDLAHVNRARLAYRRGQADMAGRMLADRFGDEQAAKMMTSLADWERELSGGSGNMVVGSPQTPGYGGSGSIVYGTGIPTSAVPGTGFQGVGFQSASQDSFSIAGQTAPAPEIPVMPTIRQRATAPSSLATRNNAHESVQAPSVGASPPRDASWNQVMLAAQAEAERARRARQERQSGNAMEQHAVQPNAMMQPETMMQPHNGVQHLGAMTMTPQGLPYPAMSQQPAWPQQNAFAGQQPGMAPQVPVTMQPSQNYGVVQQPMMQQPMVQQPLVQQPMMQQPMMQQPMMQQPMMQQPMVQQPVMQQPVMQQPMMQQPGTQQRMAQVPTMQSPGILQPQLEQPAYTAPAMQIPNSRSTVAPMADAADAIASDTSAPAGMANATGTSRPATSSESGQVHPASGPIGVPMGNVFDSTQPARNSNGRQFPIYGPGMNDSNAVGAGSNNLRTSTFDPSRQTTNTRVSPGQIPSIQSTASTQTQIAGLNAGPGGLFPIGVNPGETSAYVPPAHLTAAPRMMTVPHDHPGSMTNINGAMYQAPTSVLGTQSRMMPPNVTGVTAVQPSIPPVQMPSPQHMMLSNMQGREAFNPAAGVGGQGGLQQASATMPTNGTAGIATAVYPGAPISAQAPPMAAPAAGEHRGSAAESAAFEQLLNQLRTGQ